MLKSIPGHESTETLISKILLNSRNLKEKQFLIQQLDTPKNKERLTLEEKLNYNKKLIDIIESQEEKLEEEKKILWEKKHERELEIEIMSSEIQRKKIEEIKSKNID